MQITDVVHTLPTGDPVVLLSEECLPLAITDAPAPGGSAPAAGADREAA